MHSKFFFTTSKIIKKKSRLPELTENLDFIFS